MKTLGIDIGSSSVKVAVFDASTGRCLASTQMPTDEMAISSPQKGWAEQDPDMWWSYFVDAAKQLSATVTMSEIKAIGITYQMHGLVTIDGNGAVVRPSIIWCDSRAVSLGNQAMEKIGTEKCLQHHLNSPGNFTASKLAWVKENEPELFGRIRKVMLPGDYIAYKLSGETTTTAQGLSEGILWDFKEEQVSETVLNQYGLSKELLARQVPCFGHQSALSRDAANLLGVKEGTPITYRSGDQPNNAFSLNVLNPGEIAATAGTSGVVYGVSSRIAYDPQSRVNTFMHVNHTTPDPRLGVLLCINGTGILNSWMRRNATKNLSYVQMNELAAQAPTGSDGLTILPFGNGAERVLGNRELGAHIQNINFNLHSTAHMLRAAQEGIAFSMQYGVEVMKTVGVTPTIIRAGIANLFQSDLFAQTVADITGATIELYNTNGAIGAARGAALGAGYYSTPSEAFSTLKVEKVVAPQSNPMLQEAYENWNRCLSQLLK
jgi:xylulokinase